MTKMTKPPEDSVRVVDRRWWARAEAGESVEPGLASSTKPTYVEDLERRLADTTAQLQAALSERRQSSDEFDQARARIRREVGREVERARRAVLLEFLEV